MGREKNVSGGEQPFSEKIWPLPWFLTPEWLQRMSSMTPADRRQVVGILDFPADAKQEGAFYRHLAEACRRPRLLGLLEDGLKDKARIRTPFLCVTRRLVELNRLHGDDFDSIAFSGEGGPWEIFSLALKFDDRRNGLTSAEPEYHALIDALLWRSAVNSLDVRVAKKDFHITAELALIGLGCVDPVWEAHRKELLKGRDLHDWRRTTVEKDLLPDIGLFPEEFVEEIFAPSESLRLILLGAAPDFMIDEIKEMKLGNPAWRTTVRRLLHCVPSLRLVSLASNSLSKREVSPYWAETIKAANGADLSAEKVLGMREDERTHLAAALVSAASIIGLAFEYFREQYRKSLMCLPDWSGSDVDAVISCLARFDWNHEEYTGAGLLDEESIVSDLAAKIGADGNGDPGAIGSGQVRGGEEASGMSWEGLRSVLREAAANLPATANLEMAERILAIGSDLVRMAKVDLASRSRLAELRARLTEARRLAESLKQEESENIRAAVTDLPEPAGVLSAEILSEAIELLGAIEAEVSGLLDLDVRVSALLDAQKAASGGPEGKRVAKELAAAIENLEKAVAVSAVPDLAGKLRLVILKAAEGIVAETTSSGEGAGEDRIEETDAAGGLPPLPGTDNETSSPQSGSRQVASQQDTLLTQAGGSEIEGASAEPTNRPAACERESDSIDAAQSGAAGNRAGSSVAPSATSDAPAREVEENRQGDLDPVSVSGADASPDMPLSGSDMLSRQAIVAWGKLLERDEPGLAWHLASCLEAINRLPEGMPRPAFLEALCYGRTVLVSGDSSAIILRDRIISQIHDPAGAPEAMLAMAALVRPALLAPETDARAAAVEINPGSAVFLHKLKQVLQKLQKSGIYFNAAQLRRPPAEKDRKARAEAAKRRFLDWTEEATKRRISYHRANVVWQHFFRSDQPGGAARIAVENGDLSRAVDIMRDCLKRFHGNVGAVDDYIDRMDSEASGPNNDDIIAKARHRLREMMQLACNEMEHWLAEAGSENESGGETRISALREEVELAAREAMNGAADLLVRSDNVVERGAAVALKDSMEDILAAVVADGKGLRDRDPNGLLHDGFLRIQGQIFGGDRYPDPYDQNAVIDVIIDYAENHEKVSWADVFNERLQEHSHIATERCLAILEARKVERAELDRLAALREADIEMSRRELVKARVELRRDLDQALALDAIRDSAVTALLEEVEAIDANRLPLSLLESDADGAPRGAVADFPAAYRLLDEVRRRLRSAMSDAMGRLMEQVTDLKERGRIDGEDEKRIRGRIAKGDFASASEMIELAEEGESGFTRRPTRPFHEFFPAACEAMAADKSRLGKEIHQACENGEKFGAFDFSGLVEAHARADAARALHDWSHLKSPSKPDKRDPVIAVLSAIGFRNVMIAGEGSGDKKRRIFDLQADPIVNQRTCPIPQFGSLSGGHWRVSVWFGEATPEEIVLGVQEGGAQANLAIVTNRIGRDVRSKLATNSRRDARAVLVLDESLFIWLISRPEYRLPLFFDCAIPFTWCDPYPAIEGPVAPESFYGRTEEIRRIIDPHGSCLVFGGRQLGKTALLQQVSALVHSPEDGQVAIRMDLKPVGEDGQPEKVWEAIGDELHRMHILKNRHADPGDLIQSISRWLQADARRRLILMLDEMDNFLRADGERGYENVVRMRKLMDDTQRRCKFVLAGLHNVQRASATANTPLVHFGEPICVGPFDRGSDKAAARRMVIDPLAAAGYEFAAPWLALRILSYLNYYPSLAGVFCKRLADAMAKAAASGKRSGGDGRSGESRLGPPWVISEKDIEDTMMDEDARSSIKYRFDITLKLDNRYHLVALILGMWANADAERNMAQQPASLQDIRKEAMFWWPAGFEGRSGIEAFQALLEEMQGLGVVSRAGHGWKLRSGRIAAMIGKREQIHEQLMNFREEVPSDLKWEPGLDRSKLSGGQFRRSPFNRLQEGEITGLSERRVAPGKAAGNTPEGAKDGKRVWLVFGSEASGIEDVPEALDSVDEGIRVERFSERVEKVDAESFGWVLDRKGKDGKFQILLVGHQYPWDESWVRVAIKNATARKAGLRIVFVGNARHALAWATLGREFASDQKLGIATTQPLKGDAMRFWLRHTGLESLDRLPYLPLLDRATGGFIRFMESLAEDISDKSSLENVVEAWVAKQAPERRMQQIGIQPGMRGFMELLAAAPDGFSLRDVSAACEMGHPEIGSGDRRVAVSSRAAIDWAEAMGLVFKSGRREGSGKAEASGKAGDSDIWVPNPILTRVFA